MADIPEGLKTALAGEYEILRELGEGGMARVYLARDLKHNRQVAIKVLKDDLAAVVGEERFLAEIETTAQLQHPHILPLFDSGAADGFLYYAMPYVEGETLREKLKREVQLPVEDALETVQKIASALDYAHEKGIVHRDIKPSNILLSSGEPLVADFGIALAVSQANDGRRTETGLSLGTPHYMSPEQAAGDRSLDPRSDIYALGCVLQELLTGEPPFSGANAQAVLARILTTRPTPVTSLRPTVPPHVESAIGKALEKLPADRFKTARDFRKALSNPDFRHTVVERTMGSTAVPTQTRIVREGVKTPWVAGVGVAALLVGMAAGAALLGGSDSEGGSAPTARAVVTLPDDFEWLGRSVVRISPIDEHLVTIGGGAESNGVWIRAINESEFRRLPGIESAEDVSFSPDGRELIVVDGEEIIRVELDGSNRRRVATVDGQVTSPAWSEDGYGYFLQQQNPSFAIMRVPMDGIGEVEQVTPSATFPEAYYAVELLPGGESLLAASIDFTTDQVSTHLVDIATGDTELLLPDGGALRWVESGHVVFVDSRGDLRAVPFDPKTGRAGQPAQLEERVSVANFMAHRVSVSRRGTLLYSEGVRASLDDVFGGGEIFIVSLEGDTTQVAAGEFFSGPVWSPEGRYLAYTGGRDLNDIGAVVFDTELAVPPRPVSTDVAVSLVGDWSPDGRSLVTLGGPQLVSSTPRIADVFGVTSRAVDGGPPVEANVLPRPSDWAEDGIIWTVASSESGGIYLQPTPEDSTTLWLAGRFNSAEIAPAGDWIVYSDIETGRILARAWPEIGPPITIATGTAPRWAEDGNAIYYGSTGDSTPALRRVDVSRDPTLSVVGETLMMELGANNGWDIHPDGQRVAFATVPANDQGENITEQALVPDRTWIIFNWGRRLRDAFEGEGR